MVINNQLNVDIDFTNQEIDNRYKTIKDRKDNLISLSKGYYIALAGFIAYIGFGINAMDPMISKHIINIYGAFGALLSLLLFGSGWVLSRFMGYSFRNNIMDGKRIIFMRDRIARRYNFIDILPPPTTTAGVYITRGYRSIPIIFILLNATILFVNIYFGGLILYNGETQHANAWLYILPATLFVYFYYPTLIHQYFCDIWIADYFLTREHRDDLYLRTILSRRELKNRRNRLYKLCIKLYAILFLLSIIYAIFSIKLPNYCIQNMILQSLTFILAVFIRAITIYQRTVPHNLWPLVVKLALRKIW